VTTEPAIDLLPVDPSNWGEVIRLHVTSDQEKYVSGNAYSLLQSMYEPWGRPCAIIAGKTLVGFLMWGRRPRDDRVWLARLMVDARYQRHGYGRAALNAVIRKARDEGVDTLYLSYVLGNLPAERMYQDAGFALTGEVVNDGPAELEQEPDEFVMRLDLSERP
jgi:diamine N-acetyltransferase